jgi:hypothetical protein
MRATPPPQPRWTDESYDSDFSGTPVEWTGYDNGNGGNTPGGGNGTPGGGTGNGTPGEEQSPETRTPGRTPGRTPTGKRPVAPMPRRRPSPQAARRS